MTDRDVFYFTRFVPAYRVPILELLNDRLDGRLVVCAGDPPGHSGFQSLTTGDSAPPVSYRTVTLRNTWIRGDRLHVQPFRKAFKSYGEPAAIIAEESPRSLTLPFLMRRASRRNCPVILWGHFSSNLRSPGANTWRDRYRMHLAESATANIVYTEEIAAIVGRNVDPGKIFVARNTLDTRTLFRLYDALTGEATTNAAEAKAAKALVRERIGLPSDGTIVAFIGRLIEEKGVGLLVESVARLAERRPNGATLLVIGDGPLRERLEGESESKGVKSVFTGALPILSDSAPYLFASDLLLNPGYLGLSVVHAFSLGVPVVAPLPQGDVRFHSPEWIYVESGENGLLVDDATPQRFADAMLTVLTNQRRFSQSALEYARSHLRLESMVEGILDAIRFATGLPEAGGTHAA